MNYSGREINLTTTQVYQWIYWLASLMGSCAWKFLAFCNACIILVPLYMDDTAEEFDITFSMTQPKKNEDYLMFKKMFVTWGTIPVLFSPGNPVYNVNSFKNFRKTSLVDAYAEQKYVVWISMYVHFMWGKCTRGKCARVRSLVCCNNFSTKMVDEVVTEAPSFCYCLFKKYSWTVTSCSVRNEVTALFT